MSATRGKKVSHSPLPWHIFEGGNFIKIGTVGYDEYTEQENYLGGPFSVAEMEYNATKNHSPNHAKALANAQLIVTAVNEREQLRHALRMARTVIFASNKFGTWDIELARIDAALSDQNG